MGKQSYNDVAAATHGDYFAGQQRWLDVVERLDEQRRLRESAAWPLAPGVVAKGELEEPPIVGNEVEALAGEHTVGLQVVEVDAQGGARKVDAAPYLSARRAPASTGVARLPRQSSRLGARSTARVLRTLLSLAVSRKMDALARLARTPVAGAQGAGAARARR